MHSARLRIFISLPMVVLGVIANGQTDTGITLPGCTSEEFSESACVSKITDIEERYSLDLLPERAIEALHAAYHNMAFVSPVGTKKQAWLQKNIALYKSVLAGASTVDKLYLASEIA